MWGTGWRIKWRGSGGPVKSWGLFWPSVEAQADQQNVTAKYLHKYIFLDEWFNKAISLHKVVFKVASNQNIKYISESTIKRRWENYYSTLIQEHKYKIIGNIKFDDESLFVVVEKNHFTHADVLALYFSTLYLFSYFLWKFSASVSAMPLKGTPPPHLPHTLTYPKI